MKHTVKYWDKKLLTLQRLADSVGYDIDSDADYVTICQFLPVSRSKPAPVEILPLFYNVVERVQSVKNYKWRKKIKMKKIYRKGNAYFDTYYIHTKDGYIGMLQDHCRSVKQTYFIAFAGNPYTCKNWENRVKTFDTEEEAMEFIVKNYK